MHLSVDNFRVTRGFRTVFTRLGFSLERGRALILAGPNGSGKSTLLRMLGGMLPPETGDAVLGGVSLSGDRAEFVSNVLYAGHLDALKPAFTARETLEFYADLYDAPRERVAVALESMALGFLADQPVRVLSAGQKRRLGLARLALVDRPLWLLDEPTVSLDTESAARVALLAREHCAGGGMVIAATHIDLGIEGAARLNPADFAPSADTATAHEDDAVLDGEAW